MGLGNESLARLPRRTEVMHYSTKNTIREQSHVECWSSDYVDWILVTRTTEFNDIICECDKDFTGASRFWC